MENGSVHGKSVRENYMEVPATGEQDQMGSKCDPVLGRLALRGVC